jgi:SAM-dependent methyltransferase
MKRAQAYPKESMNSEHRPIIYLSPPRPVSMGDWWFDIATIDHFWIRRRFDVMRRLADSILRNSRSTGEVGCGNGLLQREVEDYYRISVSGFDLNEVALQKNVSRVSPLYCYDIHQRNSEFRARFDLLLLFDVLEHIEVENEFLQSIKFHLTNSGALLVNVPAHQFFHSDYDRAAGHVRRYSVGRLTKVAEENGFKICVLTYWGLPLVPLLLARKAISMRRTDGRAGFDTRGSVINGLLSCLARLEPLPQKILGTSLMAVLQNNS